MKKNSLYKEGRRSIQELFGLGKILYAYIVEGSKHGQVYL